MFRKLIILILWIVLTILTSGCDDQVTKVAREAADRQAQQNTAMADLNKEVARGAHELVEADAQARQEIVGVHRDLLAERTRLDTGWSALEGERQRIAGQRRTKSMLGPLVTLAGGLLLVTVLLGFCWFAVGAAHASEVYDSQVYDYLVREILSETPRLLSGTHRPSTALGPSDSTHPTD